MHRFFTSFLLVWLSTFSVFAQTTYSISGMITDDKNSGVDLVLVTLMTEKDSILKVTYTDQDGSFMFNSISEGKYKINASILGFENLQKTIEVSGVNNQIKLETLILSINALLIDAVTITAKTPYIERKIDRTVVNVDALIANAGSNALE
nr:carboxypeptidase-like regulatory domain-containing protein [Saprospiraceae bacterium]